MPYGKSRATGYTDFYKNATKNSSSIYGSVDDEEENSSNMTEAQKRQAAIKRRLKARKVGI